MSGGGRRLIIADRCDTAVEKIKKCIPTATTYLVYMIGVAVVAVERAPLGIHSSRPVKRRQNGAVGTAVASSNFIRSCSPVTGM